MSKIFEALQRLERELGRPPVGVSVAAQRVLQSGSLVEDAEPEGPDPAQGEQILTTAAPKPSPEVESPSGLDYTPVETATITAAARIVYHTDPDGPGADRFRLLRMHLRHHWDLGKLRVLLITSPQAQDGKSTVVLNLATALAEQGQKRVLVVEGDLHNPSLANRLCLRNGAGLAECIQDGRDPLSLVRRMEPLGWYLLEAGEPPGNPTELLQSKVLGGVFAALQPHFDWIVIDTPPLIPLTDTLSLRQYADAGLLVVRADCTPREAVEGAIGRVGTQHLLGVILDGSEELDRLYSDYGKSYGRRSRSRD